MNNITDIKKIREKLGMTQEQLANRCGVTTRTVQNWERGKTIPDNIQILLREIANQGGINASSKDGGISVVAGNDGNVNVGGETARLLSLLEHSQEQIDRHLSLAEEKDRQISRLLNLIENGKE